MSIYINVEIDTLTVDVCEVNLDNLHLEVSGTDVTYGGEVVLEGHEYCDYVVEAGDMTLDNDDIVEIVTQHCNSNDWEYIASEVPFGQKQEVLTTKELVAKMKAEGISFEALVREWFA